MGVFISLSTMAAAAFGNTISDILGIGSAFYVERLAQRIGFQAPTLTPIQLDLPKSRRAANMVSFDEKLKKLRSLIYLFSKLLLIICLLFRVE